MREKFEGSGGIWAVKRGNGSGSSKVRQVETHLFNEIQKLYLKSATQSCHGLPC